MIWKVLWKVLAHDPMGKFTNPSSKKNLPHSQNPKCSWIIIRWSFTMFVYYINLKSKMLARTGVKIVNTNVHCMPSSNLGTGFTRECIRFRENFAQCRATQQSSTDYLQVGAGLVAVLAGVVLAGSWFQSLMVLGKNELPKASLLVLSW